MGSFYANLAAHLVVDAVLFVVDLVTPGGPWFFWPLLGWGIGVAVHAVIVFGPGRAPR